jgi:hypothetical protein
MNKFHLIGPLLLTAAFVPCYIQFARVHTRQIEAGRAAAEVRRIEDERTREKNEQDAIARVREAEIKHRLAAEEKERERRGMLEANDALVRGQLEVAAMGVRDRSTTNQSLHQRLNELRDARQSTEQTAFNTVRALELRQIERRTIDLELQRRMQLAANRLEFDPLVEGLLLPNPHPGTAQIVRSKVH